MTSLVEEPDPHNPGCYQLAIDLVDGLPRPGQAPEDRHHSLNGLLAMSRISGRQERRRRRRARQVTNSDLS